MSRERPAETWGKNGSLWFGGKNQAEFRIIWGAFLPPEDVGGIDLLCKRRAKCWLVSIYPWEEMALRDLIPSGPGPRSVLGCCLFLQDGGRS